MNDKWNDLKYTTVRAGKCTLSDVRYEVGVVEDGSITYEDLPVWAAFTRMSIYNHGRANPLELVSLKMPNNKAFVFYKDGTCNYQGMPGDTLVARADLTMKVHYHIPGYEEGR